MGVGGEATAEEGEEFFHPTTFRRYPSKLKLLLRPFNRAADSLLCRKGVMRYLLEFPLFWPTKVHTVRKTLKIWLFTTSYADKYKTSQIKWKLSKSSQHKLRLKFR